APSRRRCRGAVEIARRLGATEVVAAGRNARRLAALAGATRTVALTGDVDVVLDYTWGAPTELALPALVTHRAEGTNPPRWVPIGPRAAPGTPLPSAVLRAANLRIIGSGQGSVTAAGIVAELPALMDEVAAGAFSIQAKAVPLAEVETAWTADAR